MPSCTEKSCTVRRMARSTMATSCGCTPCSSLREASPSLNWAMVSSSCESTQRLEHRVDLLQGLGLQLLHRLLGLLVLRLLLLEIGCSALGALLQLHVSIDHAFHRRQLER